MHKAGNGNYRRVYFRVKGSEDSIAGVKSEGNFTSCSEPDASQGLTKSQALPSLFFEVP
jgi:hypothetical protein